MSHWIIYSSDLHNTLMPPLLVDMQWMIRLFSFHWRQGCQAFKTKPAQFLNKISPKLAQSVLPSFWGLLPGPPQFKRSRGVREITEKTTCSNSIKVAHFNGANFVSKILYLKFKWFNINFYITLAIMLLVWILTRL